MVTVGEVVGVVAGPALAVVGVPLVEGAVDVGDVVALGPGVPLVVAGVGEPGGEVARGGGQGGNKESANNLRSCDSA